MQVIVSHLSVHYVQGRIQLEDLHDGNGSNREK